MQHMNIGEAAAAAAVTPKMIRHYEKLGLVPAPERTDAGYRLYGEREISMLPPAHAGLSAWAQTLWRPSAA